MNDYLITMENYSPNSVGTGKMMGESGIVEIAGIPQSTSTSEDMVMDPPPKYMAPQTIEVKRYRLKK